MPIAITGLDGPARAWPVPVVSALVELKQAIAGAAAVRRLLARA